MFVIGSLLFWIISLIAFAILLILVEYENTFGAGAVIIALAIVFGWGGGALGEVVGFVSSNPLLTLAFVIAYPLVGVLWAFLKWYLFAKDRKEKFILFKKDWCFTWQDALAQSENNALRAAKEALGVENAFRQHILEKRYKHTNDTVLPEPGAFKNKILNWLAYWPISMVSTLIFDFFKRFFVHIYNAIAGQLRKVAVSAFGEQASVFERGTDEEIAVRMQKQDAIRAAEIEVGIAQSQRMKARFDKGVEFVGGINE